MADLNSKKPSATFHSLLNLGTADNQTLDSSLRVVEDGRGNDSALKISTGAIQVDNIKIDGNIITSEDTNGNISLIPNNTGDVYLQADTVRVGDSGTNATITTYGAGDLILNTNSGSSSGSITIADGSNGDITLDPDGTGKVVTDAADINGGNIDGTIIGAASAAAGTFAALVCTGLTVNGNISVTGKNTKTVATTAVAGPTNNYDVAGISVLKLNTASNSVTIGGFTNGADGQILFVFKPSGANIAILEHNEGGGSQNIYLQSGADESIGVAGIKASNPMGGWILVCDGSHWYSIGK